MIENNSNYRGFIDDLKESIQSYEGEYNHLLKYVPDFFQLLCDILKDKRTDWHTKLLINSALAYFVLPDDIIPDYNSKGYLDDLFLTAFVLVEIKNNIDDNLIKDNWEGKEDIFPLIEEIHDKTKILIGDDYLNVLRLVGLKKYVSLDLNEYEGDYPKKIARLANEKRELLGLLSFITSKIYGNRRIKDQERLKQFLMEHDDFSEIERIIHIAKERKNNPVKLTDEELDIKTVDEDALRKKRINELMRGY